ncbi:MAG: histidine phosphatase family protein [Candidatus Pacearchaeota archaeon]|nr:MAG: histidine phosphatase family protein [Candidatus Pacearchaeota archaeon]
MKKEKKRKICKIYLFRHGQTYYNRDGIFTGFVDSKLTKRGIEDAKIVAERLKNKKFQVAFHTRLSRSKDTLKQVLKYHPECTRLIEDDRMLERNYGKLNTHSHWEIVRKKGPKQYDKWHRGFNIRPPKGESFADVERRVRAFLKDLFKFVKKERVDVAISAHGNSIRLVRKILEKASKEETVGWFIPYDTYFEYSVKC